MPELKSTTGLYIHVPFCKGKCPYCDFYSFNSSPEQRESYTDALCRELSELRSVSDYCKSPLLCDSLYFGGGTPSALSPDSFKRIFASLGKAVVLTEDAEITVECNESSELESLLPVLSDLGVNRISLGMQSGVTEERKALGRRGSADGVKHAVELCIENGIDNISLDIMLGIPLQTKQSLEHTLEMSELPGVKHISAYMLKLEENTVFYKRRDSLPLPDEDETCELYEYCCEGLKKRGFEQYEISNFAQFGFESKHNLKYWTLKDYLGIGPAAHSCMNNKRFFFPPDIDYFTNGGAPIFDCEAGGTDEYIMLALRLNRGIILDEFEQRYGSRALSELKNKASVLEERRLLCTDGERLFLTKSGILLSNTVICELI